MKIQNCNALITGASSGIGWAVARQLAKRGAKPILVARRKEQLEELSQLIKAETDIMPLFIQADITREADRKKIYTFVDSECEALPLLIHNAGITAHGKVKDNDPAVYRQAMEINFFAVADLTGMLLPIMMKSSTEKMVVYVSTPSAFYGIPERAAYSASKAAGNMLMESLRIEESGNNLKTLIFAPGYTRTSLRTSGLDSTGQRLKDEQAKGAADPVYVAQLLIRAIEKNRRVAFTDLNGRVVFLLRDVAPRLLEKLILWKTSKK